MPILSPNQQWEMTGRILMTCWGNRACNARETDALSYQPNYCGQRNPCAQSIDSFEKWHSVLSSAVCTVISPLVFREGSSRLVMRTYI